MIDAGDYSEKYLEQYQNQSFETVLVQVRRKQVLVSLQRHSHRHILEIGCGLEPLFPHCADFDRYTVVEPVAEFAQHARDLAAGRNGIRVFEGCFEDLYSQFAIEQGFDFIILSSLLHEVPDPGKLLQGLRSICSAATVVHINVPNIYSFHRLLAFEMGLIEQISDKSATEVRFHRHTRFEMSSLRKIVLEHGFEVLTAGTYFIKPFAHEQMQRILDQGIVDHSVITGLERMTKYLPDMGCEMFVDVKIQ